MGVDELVVVSNVALVVATAAATWVTGREGHRHEEHIVDDVTADDARVAKLAAEVIRQEHEAEAAKPTPLRRAEGGQR